MNTVSRPSKDLGKVPDKGLFTTNNNLTQPATYDVYSGVDIKAIIHLPPNFLVKETEGSAIDNVEKEHSEDYSKPLVLGDIQTLSYSIYREKYPVRSLGRGYPHGFCRGPRTISGTIIFTMFNKQVLYDVLHRIKPDTNDDLSTPLIDQLPRFDITVTFSNEYGAASSLIIYGVELFSEGVTMSIEDFFTENVVQYIAQDMRPMLPDGDRMVKLATPRQKTGSDLLKEMRLQQKIHGGEIGTNVMLNRPKEI